MENCSSVNVIPLPERKKQYKKLNLNRNKDGSIRKIRSKVYIDFIYFGKRVRVSSGLPWNAQNQNQVRDQLDKIIIQIKDGSFRFAEVFPYHAEKDYFTQKEREVYQLKKSPNEVECGNYFWKWFNSLKGSGRIAERTLHSYKSLITLYLDPFFGKMSFAELNRTKFTDFTAWAKQRLYREKPIGNTSVNKCFVPLKMICKDAAIEFDWITYNPFYGFRKLDEDDPYEHIEPFSIAEQGKLIQELPDHWKPYFQFAFCSGLRSGEQIAVKPHDINWDNRTLAITRAMTLDVEGRRKEGKTKNKYSRRTIKLLPVMFETLKEQQKIHGQFKTEYFFCTVTGKQIHRSNLLRRVWIPALKNAGLKYREMRQTRHSFATNALNSGENPLWIAKVMGHRNSEMVIKVYGKYIEHAGDLNDGSFFNRMYQGPESSRQEV